MGKYEAVADIKRHRHLGPTQATATKLCLLGGWRISLRAEDPPWRDTDETGSSTVNAFFRTCRSTEEEEQRYVKTDNFAPFFSLFFLQMKREPRRKQNTITNLDITDVHASDGLVLRSCSSNE